MVNMTFKWKLLEASNMMPPSFPPPYFWQPPFTLPFSFFLILISLGFIIIIIILKF
jgi:hypothetical protein